MKEKIARWTAALSRLHRMQDDLELSDPEMIDLFATWLREVSVKASIRASDENADHVEREYLKLIGALIHKLAGPSEEVVLTLEDMLGASEYVTVRQDGLWAGGGVKIYLSQKPAPVIHDKLGEV